MGASVWLCGELRVEFDGVGMTRRLPARQGRLLFAFLVLSRGHVTRRDELIDALWPERPPRDPDASLASVLARMRAVLGPQRLPVRGPLLLQLGDGAWVDVEVARAAAAAARGALELGAPERAYKLATEALTIVNRPLLPEFERTWLDEQRRDLAELLAPLVDVLVDAAVRIGEPALQEAALFARRGAEREPFRESAHGALMQVLAARAMSRRRCASSTICVSGCATSWAWCRRAS